MLDEQHATIGFNMKVLILSLLCLASSCVTNQSYKELSTAKTLVEQKSYTEAIASFKRLANAGSGEAAYHLYDIYYKGLGVEAIPAKGNFWLSKSVRLNYTPAISKLAVMKYEGILIPMNKFEALKLFDLAAADNVPEAMYYSALMYFSGEATQKNVKKAIGLFTKAAKAGEHRALANLGQIIKTKMLTPKEAQPLLALFDQKASNGERYAQYIFGVIFQKGLYRKANERQALKWFAVAARNGDHDAQYEIAQFYISDRIDNKQPDKAKGWFVKAASGVNVSYKQSLGLMLLIGDKLEQDSSQAFKYLLQAADGGDVYSMFVVGEMYVNGKGVVKNINKSIEYLSKAVKNGYKLALFSLAQVFEKEASVRDFKTAFKLYFESAYGGNIKAQEKVARFYAAGLGVKKSVKLAFVWHLICRDTVDNVHFTSIEEKLSVQDKNSAREIASTILKVIKENKYK